MVWSFKYEPNPPSFPDFKIAEGHRGSPEAVDPTRDDGVNFMKGAEHFLGRRIKSETLPRVIQFLSARTLQDFEGQGVYTVSNRLRALIETLEPESHQFEPVEYTSKDGSALERRWFWQICNRLDTVHRELVTWVLDGASWRPPRDWDKAQHLVFDLTKVGDAKFWHDKHVSLASFCSDDARECLVAEGITGLRYHHHEQA